MNLSSGSLASIFSGQELASPPVLQVLGFKTIKGSGQQR